MQEEVNEKTVALIIRSGKVSAEVLKVALVLKRFFLFRTKINMFKTARLQDCKGVS